MPESTDTLVIVRNAVRSALEAHHETATDFCVCGTWTPEAQEVHAIRERWELNSHQAHEVAVTVLMALRAVVKEHEVTREPEFPLTLEQVHEIVEFLSLQGRQGLLLANTLNTAMGASARRRHQPDSETRVEYVLRWTRPDTGEPWETTITPPKESSPEAALAFAVTRRDQLQEFATQQGWGENFYTLNTRTVTTTAWQEIHDV